jgi:hypothetical protein
METGGLSLSFAWIGKRFLLLLFSLKPFDFKFFRRHKLPLGRRNQIFLIEEYKLMFYATERGSVWKK